VIYKPDKVQIKIYVRNLSSKNGEDGEKGMIHYGTRSMLDK
jgi:hypothetical protein